VAGVHPLGWAAPPLTTEFGARSQGCQLAAPAARCCADTRRRACVPCSEPPACLPRRDRKAARSDGESSVGGTTQPGSYQMYEKNRRTVIDPRHEVTNRPGARARAAASTRTTKSARYKWYFWTNACRIFPTSSAETSGRHANAQTTPALRSALRETKPLLYHSPVCLGRAETIDFALPQD
jgi:hypothetical protein